MNALKSACFVIRKWLDKFFWGAMARQKDDQPPKNAQTVDVWESRRRPSPCSDVAALDDRMRETRFIGSGSPVGRAGLPKGSESK
jgi:hypothetical protein